MFHVRKCIGSNCNDCGIFSKFFRHDFVQRVSGGVVIIEIETAILDWTERGNTGFLQRFDIGANVFGKICSAGAGFLKDGQNWRENLFDFEFTFDVETNRMTGAVIRFYRRKVIRPFFLLIFRVLF